MRRITILLTLLLTVIYTNAQTEKSIRQITQEVMERASTQYINMAFTLEKGKMPRSFSKNRLITSDIYWWCSGFYPGTLWYLYEYTGSENIKKLAHTYTEKLAPLQFLKTDHDIGFQLFCSYGNGYRLTGNKEYLNILHNGAMSLATRFNPVIGSIRSWDSSRDKWKFPVIIDNMMNLELLIWIGNQYNDPYLKTVAITHANTTMKNHFRPDYSTYHLVDYDPENGKIIKKQTVQGYNDNSKWARGQAWAVYGYVSCYRETGDKEYLDFATKIADMIMARVKTDDAIPLWDYDAPEGEGTPRDASAASVTASALIEMSTMVPDGKKYLDYAEKILKSLSSDAYLAKVGENQGFILMHSVGSLPNGSEIDTPLNYADYYYLEALKRFMDLKKLRLENGEVKVIE